MQRKMIVLFLITLIFVTFTGCVTERVVVVEKEKKDPNDEHHEKFKEIVADVAGSSTKYIGKEVTIRGEILEGGGDFLSYFIYLRTNNPKVLFTVGWNTTGREITYKKGLDYNFTVRIRRISVYGGVWHIDSVNIGI